MKVLIIPRGISPDGDNIRVQVDVATSTGLVFTANVLVDFDVTEANNRQQMWAEIKKLIEAQGHPVPSTARVRIL